MTASIATPQTTAHTGTWAIDAAHPLAEFSASHWMITMVQGRIAGVRGPVSIDEASPERSRRSSWRSRRAASS